MNPDGNDETGAGTSQDGSSEVYLGLGSNIGDRYDYLRDAIRRLEEKGLTAEAVSSAWETEPVGEILDQPDFLNAAIRVRTELEPEDLLDLLKLVEAELGRETGLPRHSPRVIDIDLLLMGDLEYESDRLRLPHRETTSRRFVLAPLLELDPDLALPDGTRLAEAMASLEAGGGQDIRRAGSLTAMSDSYDFAVSRDDLRDNSILENPGAEREIDDGQILLAIDHFSLTANNVTYGAMGDAMSYWNFYPAPDGLGLIPAWGYAEVIASKADGVEEGARVFGYFPMSTHAVLEPGRIRKSGFTDVTDYRTELPAVYNEYRLVNGEKDDERERLVAIFMPLYGTSWLLADWLNEIDFGGAAQLVASSASSKTALGLGHALQVDFESPIETVGLTSPGNLEFTKGTGHWDAVVTYDDLTSLDPETPTIYVDFGGNAELRHRVHSHFGDRLLASVAVGIADWESMVPDENATSLPGPQPQFFFAPDRVVKRNADWGEEGLGERLAKSQDRFTDRSRDWMEVEAVAGPDAIRESLLALMDGKVPPDKGISVNP